jgi:uncharacterized protein YprB with RNaseH-like and TPR domain
VSDESIRDRLMRLRRCPERTARVADASENEIELIREPSEIGSIAPQVEEACPVPSDAQLDRADKSAASTPAESERASIFTRLSRRWKTVEAVPVQPRELSLDPPRDLVRSERGTWSRTKTFERHHRHGSFALEELLATSCTKLSELARDERIAAVDLERAIFFDTETTGLSGGAGTYVFLVGMGRFTPVGFELWQGFLPHPADEKSLLEEVAERIAEASAILSFFGKSFDRHRLEDKMRLHGVTPPFESSIHLDLYYPLRRAHRGKFENCRLKTLERELAGVQRADDLPGSFAPAAWFDFLARRPHQLEGVFRHNADDVLSLVTLAAHLGR